MKKQPTKWEKIFANHISDKVNNQRIHTTQQQRTNNLILKKDRVSEKTFYFLRRHTDDQ